MLRLHTFLGLYLAVGLYICKNGNRLCKHLVKHVVVSFKRELFCDKVN